MAGSTKTVILPIATRLELITAERPPEVLAAVSCCSTGRAFVVTEADPKLESKQHGSFRNMECHEKPETMSFPDINTSLGRELNQLMNVDIKDVGDLVDLVPRGGSMVWSDISRQVETPEGVDGEKYYDSPSSAWNYWLPRNKQDAEDELYIQRNAVADIDRIEPGLPNKQHLAYSSQCAIHGLNPGFLKAQSPSLVVILCSMKNMKKQLFEDSRSVVSLRTIARKIARAKENDEMVDDNTDIFRTNINTDAEIRGQHRVVAGPYGEPISNFATFTEFLSSTLDILERMLCSVFHCTMILSMIL